MMFVRPDEKMNREKGIALVTVLMFLMVMMIIGAAAMQSSTLQQWMSGSSRDQDVAFQAAESAVREGESWIENQLRAPNVISGGCSTPPCQVAWNMDSSDVNGGRFLDQSWWNSSTNTLSGTGITGVKTPPKYIIELVGTIQNAGDSKKWNPKGPTSNLYRVTARGTGLTNDSRSIVQSTYAKRY